MDGLFRLASIEIVIDAALMQNSHDAARYLEDEVERRGLQEAYIFELAAICDEPWTQEQLYSPAAVFALLRATPAQRARAFLQAVEGQH